MGAVVVSDNRILMCRRAVEPRKGFWTLPAAYKEFGETLEQGDDHKALEVKAVIPIDGIPGIFSIVLIGRVQVILWAVLPIRPRHFFACLEVCLFRPHEVPWNEIAFPSVYWALHAWLDSATASPRKPAERNPLIDRRGVHQMQFPLQA